MAKRHLYRALLVIAVALSPLVALFVRADSPIATKPIYTQYRTFRIPFRLDPAEADRLKAIELYVSKDQGATWERYHSTSPSGRDFTYRSEGDGEYWFGVRTVDSLGKAQPANVDDLTPGLKVIVDSQAPEFSLETRSLRPGLVAIDWKVTDANADLASLVIEGREAQEKSGWKPLKIQPAAAGRVRLPTKAEGPLEFRAKVRDLAGNVAEAESRTTVAASAPAEPPKPAAQPARRSEVSSNQPISLEDRFEDQLRKTASEPAPEKPRAESSRDTVTEPPKPDASSDLPKVTTGRESAAAYRNVPTVNAHMFTLDYQLDDVGPSGVGLVELWMTSDDGKTWNRYGEDQDRKSPFEVKVAGDGLYGFALVVRSGADLGHEPPHPGDAPQLRVLVDTLPPQAQLIGARAGRGELADRVEIRWQANDIGLADTPVALFYAEKPTGAWKPVATRLQNSGSYSWEVGRTVPEQVFLRLQVRDRAGNVQVVDSTEPVTIDRSRPNARLVGVAAAERETRRR